jgi:ADP-heptose:LPS heptosyltransferase
MANIDRIDRVLVIKLGPVRDFILSLPAMARIREVHEKARITLLTGPHFDAFARASKLVNDTIVQINPTGPTAWLGLVGRVREGRFQRVYDLEASAGSGILFQALRPFPPPWSGTASGCSLPHRNPRRAQMHPLERRADQLKDAGIWPDAPVEPGSAPEPDLSFLLERGVDARALSSQSRPVIVLAPGGVEPALRWPVERYSQLAQAFTDRGYDIVVAGSPEDAGLARTIQRNVARVRDLTGRSDLLPLAALTARAHLVVGCDPDVMQVAAAASIGAIMPLPSKVDPSTVAPRGHVTVLTAKNLNDLEPASVLQVAPALLPSRA